MSQSNSKKAKRRTRTTSNLSIADAIANVASTTRRKEEPAAKRSRFLFTLEEPPILEEEKLRPVNEELVQETKALQDELPAKMLPLVNDVRNFFLKELAPLTLAGTAGAQQARKALSEALGAEVDAGTEMKFHAMLSKAADIKLLSYIKGYMGLTNEETAFLLESIKPNKPANIVLPLGDTGAYKAKSRPGTTEKSSQGREREKEKTGTNRRRGSPRPGLEEEIDLP